MKKFLGTGIVLVLLVATSCKKPNVTDKVIETETSEALSNKDIDSSVVGGMMNYAVITGNKTVFKYDHTWSHTDPAIADGYSHLIYAFAVNLSSSQTSFILADNQIKQGPGFYAFYAVPAPSNSVLISKGRITGTKINTTTWNVVMHFEFANSTIDLTKDFVVK